MKILTGEQSAGAKINVVLRSRGWGRMYVERKPDPYPLEPWGFDNGAFGWWKRQLPFDEHLYRTRLDRAYLATQPPYIAVCPDMVAGGLHSLAFSLKWMAQLPKDWPWYLAVQDGMEPKDVENLLHFFSGLFLGGTDGFKRTARQWVKVAHAAGKKFHYARAGTVRKVQTAFRIGSDSVDSALPLWSKEQLAAFTAAITRERHQRLLFRLSEL